ncbi:hypothetical protein POM88_002711 [Heracleum sosnowskyi]|uniref:Disease resistance protein At4g27190-like leucine-rich repeats domain-containing protein n=1 Tax=Heracleum sosnowskyi TaxID=360622 RepID=A0AAD8JI65_9APIA|nr:hypothetical protein POM88_002711 [Heracleum sosnowskyi]
MGNLYLLGRYLLQVVFPSLEKLELVDGLQEMSGIWGNHYYNNVSSFCKLKTLTVYGCDKLETVISLCMLHRLQNLESIDIRSCESVTNAFVSSIARDLAHLKEMYAFNCKKMTELIGGR